MAMDSNGDGLVAQVNFDVLCIQMRGYHDFGCSLQDPSVPLAEIQFMWRRGQVAQHAQSGQTP
jgi:hypothetical protein